MTARAPAALARHRRRSLGREITRLVGRGTAWAVIIAAAMALTVAIVIPTVAGGTALTILTGSMRPSMPPGTLVVIRPIEPNNLRIGDVITRHFTTRRNANRSDDPRPVRAVQIKGEKWDSVPHLGWVNSLLSPQERGTGRLAIAATLFTYALWMLLSNRREDGLKRHRTTNRKRRTMNCARRGHAIAALLTGTSERRDRSA